MAFNLSDFFFGAGRGAAGRNLQQGEQYAYLGANPYQGQQDALLQQLMSQMQGNDSLAGRQFVGAQQENIANQASMSRGRGAGAARSAMGNMGQMGTGLAAGQATAQLQERLGATQMLQGSLSQAHQMDFQRAMANQAMYQQALQQMMSQGGIGQSLMGLAGQGLGAYAMLRGSKVPGINQKPQGAGPGGMSPQPLMPNGPEPY